MATVMVASKHTYLESAHSEIVRFVHFQDNCGDEDLLRLGLRRLLPLLHPFPGPVLQHQHLLLQQQQVRLGLLGQTRLHPGIRRQHNVRFKLIL